MSRRLSNDLIRTLRKLVLDGAGRAYVNFRLHVEPMPVERSASDPHLRTRQRLDELNKPLAFRSGLGEGERRRLEEASGSELFVGDLHDVEYRLSIMLPGDLKDLWTRVADGGIGPGVGIYHVQKLEARYRALVDTFFGPQEQAWPRQLLPIWGDDWNLVSVNLESGEILYWDVGELDIDADARSAPWAQSFKIIAPSLEHWLRRWLDEKGVELVSDPDPGAPAAPPAGLSDELVKTLRELALDGERRTDARRSLHLEGLQYDSAAERSPHAEIEERLGQTNPSLAAVVANLYHVEKSYMQHVLANHRDDRAEGGLDGIEQILSIKLPDELRDFYTRVANGGVGPGLGFYHTNDLLERYRSSLSGPVGPQGQQWPRHLLPVWGDGWDCISVDLNAGDLVRWDVGQLRTDVDPGESAPWNSSFSWVAASLEEWLRKWLEDTGVPIFVEPSEPPASKLPRTKIESGKLLQRYIEGEREEVWSDLVELGDAVVQEPVHSEALAVARETMARARRNIEKIISRLDHLGYQFKDGLGRPLAPQDPQVFSSAPAGTRDLIAQLEEKLNGPLPLSLRAFYEEVRSVSLIGSHELLSPPYKGQPDLADPFFIFGLDALIEELDDIPADERDEGAELTIAPDDLTKSGVSGAFYYVDLPCPAADFDFLHFRKESFVGYLRTVFKWGGFPGWERSKHPPLDLIAELTEGLEPI